MCVCVYMCMSAYVHLNSYLPSDDYRFTTALCILKQLVQQYHTGMPATPTRTPTPLHTPSPVSQTPHSRPPSSGTRADGNDTTSRSPSRASTINHPLSKSDSHPPSPTSCAPSRAASSIPTRATVPEEAVGLALRACEAYLSSRDHNDIEGSQLQLVCACPVCSSVCIVTCCLISLVCCCLFLILLSLVFFSWGTAPTCVS